MAKRSKAAKSEPQQVPRLSWLDLGAAEHGPEVLAVLDRTREKVGHVRNGQLVTAHKPALLLAQDALSRALTQDPELSLPPRERELIATVVSVENRCTPCIFGHAAQLRRLTGDAVWVGQVEANYRDARLDPRERAIADYALKLTRTPAEVGEADVAALRDAGLSEVEILEAAAITAYFNFSNRLNSGVGVAPNPEAYAAHR